MRRSGCGPHRRTDCPAPAAAPALATPTNEDNHRIFQCVANTQTSQLNVTGGRINVMIDEDHHNGMFSMSGAYVQGAPLPVFNTPFDLNSTSKLTPGQEVYEWGSKEAGGRLVHTNYQDEARPNEWNLIVGLRRSDED